MLTIKTKIIIAYTLVFGVMLVLFAYFIYRDTQEVETAKIDARLETHAAKIITELEEESDSSAPVEVRTILGIPAEGLTGLRIQLFDQSGKTVVADSVLQRYPTTTWREAVAGRRQREVLHIGGREYRCLWVPIELNDQYPAAVQLAASLAEVDANLRRLLLFFFMGIPLALIVAALAAYLITRMAFRPILGMVETARQITARDLHHRLALPAARDEVRLLGETLNNMIERIEASFRSQKQFVADASHEIRTPLTVICSELEFAERRVTEPSVKESIQTSLSEIDRLAKLTDSLLLLARLDASQLKLNLQPVRLDELLVECVQLAKSIADKKNIRIRVDLEEALTLRADRERMKSIILNLLDNAVKYSGNDTTVSVSLARRNSSVMLSVADQGPGIPADVLTDIFKRFYRVDASRTQIEGSGLGLAIVERLVELHGGKISVHSEEGKGATFTVELPLAINS
ncbi:MAG: HAMP domain-containing sensor histidine kinase [Bacteroidota bacterium]|jgi:heavy metal sensor kinase